MRHIDHVCIQPWVIITSCQSLFTASAILHQYLWYFATPSFSDVRTQADYQLLDPNFIGLIFSCFNQADKV